VLYVLGEGLAAGGDVSLVRSDSGVNGDGDALAKSNDLGIACGLFGVLLLSCEAADECDRGGVEDAELCFEASGGRLLASELEDEWVGANGDRADFVGFEVVLVAELDDAVDDGMDDDAAGEWLVGVEGDLVVLAEAIDEGA
jgi:hypothetical protein